MIERYIVSMKEDVFTLPNIPGYVDIKEAAKILGVAESSVYRYIQSGRLQAYQAGRNIMITVDALRQFRPTPTGRPRKKAALWRASPDTSSFFITYMKVEVRSGQQEKLLKKLWTIKQEERHLFPGTVMRFISLDNVSSEQAMIQLVWKIGDIADEKELQQELDAFELELTDVLNWETAQYNTDKVIIHT